MNQNMSKYSRNEEEWITIKPNITLFFFCKKKVTVLTPRQKVSLKNALVFVFKKTRRH